MQQNSEAETGPQSKNGWKNTTTS